MIGIIIGIHIRYEEYHAIDRLNRMFVEQCIMEGKMMNTWLDDILEVVIGSEVTGDDDDDEEDTEDDAE